MDGLDVKTPERVLTNEFAKKILHGGLRSVSNRFRVTDVEVTADSMEEGKSLNKEKIDTEADLKMVVEAEGLEVMEHVVQGWGACWSGP